MLCDESFRMILRVWNYGLKQAPNSQLKAFVKGIQYLYWQTVCDSLLVRSEDASVLLDGHCTYTVRIRNKGLLENETDDER